MKSKIDLFLSGRALGIRRFFIPFFITLMIFCVVAFRIYVSLDTYRLSEIFTEFWQSILMTLSCTLFFSIFWRVLRERFHKISFLYELVNIPIAAAFYFYFSQMPLNSYMYMYTFGGMLGVFFITIYLLWNAKGKSDIFRNIFISFWKSFGISLLAFILGFVCLQGVRQLLLSTFSDNWTIVLFSFVFCVIGVNLFLSYLPKFDDEIKKETSLLWLLRRVLLPLYVVHMLILYAYIGKIVYLHEMPIGVMNGYSLFASVFYALFYFSLNGEDDKLSNLFLRIGGLFMIPVFIVQGFGLYIRITAYGLTSMRYISILCMFFSILVALFGVLKGRSRRLLPLATILVIIATLSPINLIDVPAYDQANRLNGVVDKYNIVKNNKVFIPSNISDEDKKILKSSYQYLRLSEGSWRYPYVAIFNDNDQMQEFIYNTIDNENISLTKEWEVLPVDSYKNVYIFAKNVKKNGGWILHIDANGKKHDLSLKAYIDKLKAEKSKNILQSMIFKVDENHVIYFSEIHLFGKDSDEAVHVEGYLLEK